MEIKTRYGTLHACCDEEYDGNGALKGCNFDAENPLETEYGMLVPRFGPENVRSKYGKTVGFYPNGQLRRIALEKTTEVRSPIGEFPAELLTFYEDGAMCRVFPLNGKITGFWTEEDEEKLAVPLHFSFEFGDFSAKIISVHFYRTGSIQSITLFPKERISVQLPIGKIRVRTGFSLYEDGTLQSLEPAEPTPVLTPIGTLHAYDSNPVGITADRNSLELEKNGTVRRLSTVTDKVIVQTPDARLEPVAPAQIPNPSDDESSFTLPVKVEFSPETIRFFCEKTSSYNLSECAFSILSVPYEASFGCSGCSGCSGFCPLTKPS